ncbi:MAG: hydrogenase small subunit [bacterium]|nr:hydrogenase small subunit [bacterium]
MKIKEYPVIWFKASDCSGCTISVLNTRNPTVLNFLINPVIPGGHINLVFQLTIMAGSGEMVIDAARTTAEQAKGEYILVIEGAIPFKDDGLFCCMGENEKRREPVLKSLEKFAQDAQIIIAIGTCAAFGGISAAAPNPANCQTVNHFLSGVNAEGINTPLINLPGCPCHPHWFMGTLKDIVLKNDIELDEYSRPLKFYGDLIHNNCPRNDDYMKDVFAAYPGDKGCFKKMGCKGRVTYTNCPALKWNNGISWCIEAGTPCIGCAHPHFPDIEISELVE